MNTKMKILLTIGLVCSITATIWGGCVLYENAQRTPEEKAAAEQQAIVNKTKKQAEKAARKAKRQAEEAAAAAKAQAEYEANTQTYKVVSVHEYTEAETTRFGQVTGTEVYYSISYLNENGEVCNVDRFRNLAYGTMKLIAGPTDCYIICPDGLRELQLSDATFAKLTGTN